MAYEWKNDDRSRKCCQTFSPLRSPANTAASPPNRPSHPAVDRSVDTTECDLTGFALWCKVYGGIIENTYENTLVQAFRLVLRTRLGSGRNRVRSRGPILPHGIEGSGRTFSLRE